MKIPLVGALFAAAVLSATAGAEATLGRAGVTKCFTSHQVIVDGFGSHYFPKTVTPRSHQLAISFPFTAGESGLSGIVFLERSAAAARAARERAIQWSIKTGHGTRAVYEPYVERHGAAVVGWWSTAHKGARRIVAACLGPATP
jgi:hypothetical protein